MIKMMIAFGFTTVTGLLGLIYHTLDKKIGESQPKDMCMAITNSLRTEIQMSNKMIENELKYIKEAVDELRHKK